MRAIFCGNLEYDARQSEVERLFKKYGRVERVDMKSGFAFVYMEDEKDADDAIRRLDRAEFGRKGRRLRVEWTKQERDNRRSGGGARKPAANDKPSKTLFVINFDPIYTKSKDLERHFDAHGKIANIRIRRNFAFIQYETLEDATRALEATNMSKLMDRVITVEYAIRDDDRSNGHSPERRGRDFSPERGSYRKRSPSPYRRERGSPDYGYRRERGSPDYGRGGKHEARGSPEYGRDESPANGRYHSRSKPEGRGTPDYGRDESPANGRYHSRSKPEARGTPDYGRDESPAKERHHSRSKPEARGTPDYARDEGPANGGRYSSRSPPPRERSRS
ncbi:serine/arginine-rich splicing factor RS40 isoform X1 [Beta vulgaris subsp. vulgaris]|uniref:serine/arginine-rich splicing factor RS40 isoform X1 n=1 Tax=Beta vulgaris subsp. vulgaris TaxID=3555 RepID=UPI00203677D8|nr:serine/arginine-rich splicing factor RS40 isoform X1 [Beta vulgaris subsp. vulgaris]